MAKADLIEELKEQIEVAQEETVALEDIVDKVMGKDFLLSRVRLSNLWLEEDEDDDDTLSVEQTGEDLEFTPIKLSSFTKEQLKELIKAFKVEIGKAKK